MLSDNANQTVPALYAISFYKGFISVCYSLRNCIVHHKDSEKMYTQQHCIHKLGHPGMKEPVLLCLEGHVDTV